MANPRPVQGRMSGWPLLPQTRAIRGSGLFVEDLDIVDSPPGSTIPPHFLYWRFPPEDAFAVSLQGHPNTLRLHGHLFDFSVDVVFEPKLEEAEIGVTAFITQTQHLDLGTVLLPKSDSSSKSSAGLAPHLRFRVTDVPGLTGDFNGTVPTVIKPLPKHWLNAPIQLQENEAMGIAPATILSGGDGRFTGILVGVYATSNGGNGTTESYISGWRSQGKGQDINNGAFVPYSQFVGSS
ncbi:hypothetical protein BDZ45DRAFT_742510 [Acephala macrosclerotiorum]|nr:hypothetical protein BDZ45DRAFT_742510 [Acephala macrosclerotiorum]